MAERRYGAPLWNDIAGENSWCARRYSLATSAGGLTWAARMVAASRALAMAFGGTSTIENAVHPTTVTAAMRFAEQLGQWARDGQPGQRKRAVQLFDDLNALLVALDTNGNRKLLWEKWLLSV